MSLGYLRRSSRSGRSRPAWGEREMEVPALGQPGRRLQERLPPVARVPTRRVVSYSTSVPGRGARQGNARPHPSSRSRACRRRRRTTAPRPRRRPRPGTASGVVGGRAKPAGQGEGRHLLLEVSLAGERLLAGVDQVDRALVHVDPRRLMAPWRQTARRAADRSFECDHGRSRGRFTPPGGGGLGAVQPASGNLVQAGFSPMGDKGDRAVRETIEARIFSAPRVIAEQVATTEVQHVSNVLIDEGGADMSACRTRLSAICQRCLAYSRQRAERGLRPRVHAYTRALPVPRIAGDHRVLWDGAADDREDGDHRESGAPTCPTSGEARQAFFRAPDPIGPG